MNEIWKSIPEYENYQVSNLGNIKNVNYKGTGKTKIIKGHINKGYIYVALSGFEKIWYGQNWRKGDNK